MVTRPVWATSSGIMPGGTVRHFSDPVLHGQCRVMLIQDDGQVPFVLVVTGPPPATTEELSLAEAAAAGIDVAAVWGVR